MSVKPDRGGEPRETHAITLARQPERFNSLLLSIPSAVRNQDPRYGAFGARYYPAVYGSRLRERSFAQTAPDGEVVIVECDLLEDTLGRLGMPLRILAAGPKAAVLRKLTRRAVAVLTEIAVAESADVVIADHESRERLSELGLACLAAGGRMQVRLHAIVDLSHSEQEIRADVRKSAKPQLNWGRRSLQLHHCNAANPDRGAFDRYRSLHAEVAGRVTRSEESWEVMFDAVREGTGELTLAYLEDEFVGGLLVIDGDRSCYYASGTYIRERFDLPLAHWPLMDAILRARQRGLALFDVGLVPFTGEGTDKELAIGHFKKAFTSRIDARAEWCLDPRMRDKP
jgi:hypothetical protein